MTDSELISEFVRLSEEVLKRDLLPTNVIKDELERICNILNNKGINK